MQAEGALPAVPYLLPPVRFPELPGAPPAESYSVSFSLLCLGILILAAINARLALSPSPRGVQNFLEWMLETVEAQAAGILGSRAAPYMPFFIALFLFILAGTLIGLVPGCMSPTADYHTNLGMALSAVFLSQWAGIRTAGLRGYLGHFLPPPSPWWLKWSLLWWMWPLIHALEQVIRPISLTVRLFGNIYAKEMLLLLLSVIAVSFLYEPNFIVKTLAFVPILLRPGIILLGTLVSIVQAAVFTILAMVYVALAVETHEYPESAGRDALRIPTKGNQGG